MKIVSLLPSSTEILCALGLEENIAGITHECDFPSGVSGKPHLTSSRISHETMSSREIDHAVRSQLDGHGSIYNLNTELMAKINPDLVITQELCEVCAVSYQRVLQAAKIFVAEAKVVSLEPNTLADIFANIITIGELCGVSAKAEEVVDSLQRRVKSLRSKINESGKIERPAVFMMEWLDPPFAPGHWVPEQVEIAGGKCLLGSAGGRSVTLDFQQVYESFPEILVLIPCGYYISDIIKQMDKTVFPENWKKFPAIRNGEIWALDASAYFSRPAPRVVDGAEILAKIFHPEIFGKPSEKEAVRILPEMLKFASS